MENIDKWAQEKIFYTHKTLTPEQNDMLAAKVNINTKYYRQ